MPLSRSTEVRMSFRRRGGKVAIVLPDGSRAATQQEATVDNTMIKVLARAFRWQRLMNDGTYTSMDEMAAAEKISPSYISRILRLTYLSPTIVQAILDGQHPAHLTMKDLLVPFPLEWKAQAECLSWPRQ
ncbi:MAG: hypothetical protein IPP91_20120 [Betaproteobacteria bacterium]|nr:hypothetical protein [Betaproteobacteria bacterium]